MEISLSKYFVNYRINDTFATVFTQITIIMKKILLTLTAIAGLTVAAKAQDFGFKKQDFIIEGNFKLNTENDKTAQEKVSTYSFTPQVGYFVSDKIAVGLTFVTNGKKETNYAGTTDTYDKTSFTGGAVFGRYYFLEVGSRFKTYTQVAVGLGAGKTGLTETEKNGTKVNAFGANAGIGANFFLTEKLAINFAFADVVSYTSTKPDVDGAKADTEFQANVNDFKNFFNTATFGLTFKL